MYPEGLQDAICEGLVEALNHDDCHRNCDGEVVTNNGSSGIHNLEDF